MSDIAGRPAPGAPNVGAEMLVFWEKGRVMYNAILAVVTLTVVGFTPIYWPLLIGLAILANVLYCVAYPIDILMRETTFADGWLRIGRWLLLAAGTALAAVLAISVSYGLSIDPLAFTLD
jgi:hypothetical protein